MVKIMIFNRDEEYIGSLSQLLSAKQVMELNGEDFIELETLDDRVEKGFRLLYHDRDTDKFFEYIVQSKDEYKEGNDIVSSIYADNSLSETMWDFIEDRRTIDQPAEHAIDRALESTRWYSGEIDDMGLGTATFFRTNARAAISKIAEEWLFEIETEILWDYERKTMYRMIHFRESRGRESGVRITYTRDILEIKRRTLPRDITTALYGFGKGVESSSGGIGRRLNFSEINGGKKYVENLDAKKKWGRKRFDGERMHTFSKVEFDNITDPSKLLSRTKKELDSLSKPAVSYETKILDYFRLSKSEHDYIELGDEVKILDRDFTPEINYNTRILKIERNLLDKEDTSVTLGELVKTLADRESEQDKEIEEEREELPDWGDDDDDDWGPGELQEYERAGDMVKVYPELKIGLSSWVDVNENSSLLIDGSGGVAEVKDAITNVTVYKQDEASRRPTAKGMGGRRWISFNPDPRTLQRWKGDSRPEGAIKQHGQYLEHVNTDKRIRTIYISYYDRTPEPVDPYIQSSWGLYSVENMFPVGGSSPLGHPHGQPSFSHSGIFIHNPGNDRIFMKDERVRDEYVIGRVMPSSTAVTRQLNYLGMSKPSYNSYSYARGYRTSYLYEYNRFFTGEISEIIIYNRELDSREHNLITSYLESKYDSHSVLE